MNTDEKPFSFEYVIATTISHMQKSIDISIRKTFERVKDFDENTDKSKEIFYTLSELHKMRKSLDDYQNTVCNKGQ